jgi:hypothetical protein
VLITCKQTNKGKICHRNPDFPFLSPSTAESLVMFYFQQLMVLFHQLRVSSQYL